ncbi:hypothetical protein WR25_04351 [Diploscapter pachys]|uniref:G-protein coupled receptors family 1 profile domain-containing protein n=1 Tax=Diploscapter pachys TaxID=2018661 RepID=A0A2A2LYS9_9BILA|nr:hypothetical protein WR25_04351 [Diploscapter pachys]
MYTKGTPSPFDSVSYNISGGTISPLDPENIYAEPDPSYYLSLIIISCFIGYICTIVYGIPSNLYVVYRMCKLSRKSSDMYSNGAGRCLLLMALADIGSLTAISYFVFINFNDNQLIEFDRMTILVVCKLATFMMHTCTFISIWSWLLMSTLRYVSVYYPFIYIRLWKLPNKVLVTIIFVAVCMNSWLFISITDQQKTSCTINPLFGSYVPPMVLLFIDSLCSFIIPCLTIVYVDASVLCSLRFSRLLKADVRSHASSPRQLNPYMTRWLLLALVDVCLNAPENLMRLLLIAHIIEYRINDEVFTALRHISQVLYYSQFGYNCVYLALFIYDKPTRPANRRICESHSAVELQSERPKQDK